MCIEPSGQLNYFERNFFVTLASLPEAPLILIQVCHSSDRLCKLR